MVHFPEYTASRNKRCPFSRYSYKWRGAHGLPWCTSQELGREEEIFMTAGQMYQHVWMLTSECMGHMFLLALSDLIEGKAGIYRESPRFRERRLGEDGRIRGWGPAPDKYTYMIFHISTLTTLVHVVDYMGRILTLNLSSWRGSAF